ncbi:MAG: hypothetical protein Q8900_02495 [Bacillota bacterium]|nr:hypothetical protein [Bacillota bacterium]
MFHKANLLLANCTPVFKIDSNIIKGLYKACSKSPLAFRFRGTKVVKEDGQTTIIAWQRNVSILQKMDVSLPTVITIFLDNNNNNIKKIVLNPEFTGSQGITCSHKYIQRLLDEKLTGQKFEIQNKNIVSTKNIHCLHTEEVLFGALSLLQQYKDSKAKEYDESETTEIFKDNNIHYCTGLQCFSNGIELHWQVAIKDFEKSVILQQDGRVKSCSNLLVEFTFSYCGEDNQVSQIVIDADTNQQFSTLLTKYFFKCWKQVRDSLELKGMDSYYHTNLYPSSMMALVLQTLGIGIFENNYVYVHHMISNLQRVNGRPLCIGVIKNFDEASQYFPEFNPIDLY